MRTTKFRCVIVGLAILATAGCGGATGGVESPPAISGPPPKTPTDDLMAPKSKKAAKGQVPRGFGGPPAVPKH